jgi:transposase-like protein
VERLLRGARIEPVFVREQQRSRRPRWNHSPAFKAKVAIEALGDGKTIAEIAYKHDVHPNHVTEWRRQMLERSTYLTLVTCSSKRGRRPLCASEEALQPCRR